MIGDLPDLIAKRAALSPRAVALEDAASGRTQPNFNLVKAS